MRITAAVSPCPNDVFIFAGLLTGSVGRPGWEFAFDLLELEELNRGAQAGRWDLAKISYANFRRVSPGYRLLRCGGALGRGCGPLLLSNGGDWDPEAEVLVPGEFTTANFLLDFHHAGSARPGEAPRPGALPRPLRKAFVPFDEIYRRLQGPAPCQGVVIHEMRFTYAADGLRLLRDLGEAWEASTGHPIPLGALALRERLAEEIPGIDSLVEDLVRASLDWSRAHPAQALDLCRRHAQSMAEDVLRAHIDLYVNDFSRDLGPGGEQAVRYFLDRQAEFLGHRPS